MQNLEVPREDEQNPEAKEILRAWVLPNDEIGFVTSALPVDDPAWLGIVFADLARHFFKVAGKEPSTWRTGLTRVAEGLMAEAQTEPS